MYILMFFDILCDFNNNMQIIDSFQLTKRESLLLQTARDSLPKLLYSVYFNYYIIPIPGPPAGIAGASSLI